jgi:hypothetical protein
MRRIIRAYIGASPDDTVVTVTYQWSTREWALEQQA